MKKFIIVTVCISILLCILVYTNYPFLVKTMSNDSTSYTGSNLKIGAWIGRWPTSKGISGFEKLQGRHLDVLNIFIDWGMNFENFKNTLDEIYNNKSIAMLSWEAIGLTTVDIASGIKDDYIRQMAKDLKLFEKEIWVGTMHEVNGNWYPWCIGDSTINTKDTYIRAFRHIVDIFRTEGAYNVKWLYNIDSDNVGANSSFMFQYPGDDYVDIISINGYNWGTSTTKFSCEWRTFDEVYYPAYEAVKVTNKPIILGEWSSTETGGDKAEWIEDAFDKLNSEKYSQIKAVIWFNEKKETDWRINSSAVTLEAYKKALKHSGSSR